MEEAVKQHYNCRERYTKNEACGIGRRVTNVVKNTCIEENIQCRNAINLFGGGHGAQISFLQKMLPPLKQVNVYDLSEEALQEASDRCSASLPCTLHPCDFTQPLPSDQQHCETQLVEAGLCLHYAAMSERSWTQAILNCKQLMKKNARLVVTVPHSEHIMLLFRTQWVRVHCGCSWEKAYETLILKNDDCAAAVHELGEKPVASMAEYGIPADIATKLAADDPDFELLRQRACGVIHVDNVFTILADWVVSWDHPPTLGDDEWGKVYYFRLHAKATDNTFCPEPLIPAKGWDIMAEQCLRQVLSRQTLLQWLWNRRKSCSPSIFQALGRDHVDSSVELYLHSYSVTVLHLYEVPQPVMTCLPVAKMLQKCGRSPAAQHGFVCFKPPLVAHHCVDMRWDRVLGFVKEEKVEEEQPQKQFILTEEALKELLARKVS